MANSSSSIHLKMIICSILAVLMISSTTTMAAATIQTTGYEWLTTKEGCRGTIAECMAAGAEFEVDSESNRRILATSNYISYGALQRNNVPCSQRGASYYNCKQGAQANPYTRGCSAITRCRSS